MWFVYLLLCKDKSIYTGSTNNVEKRFRIHREGKGGRYTRSHPPVKVLYVEKFRTRGRALKREAEIKKWGREEKLILIKYGKQR